jgi:signal transduction histidine kinase
MSPRDVVGFACLLVFVVAAGCSEYVAPGRGADMSQVGLTPEAQKQGTDFDMRAAFERKPLARFPAAVAVVRIQAPEYASRTAQGWGHGNYCVVTNRDVEKPEQFQKLSKLPMLHGIAPISRSLVTTSHFTSHEPLRQAAAQLQADMLLIYTIDTAFYVRDMATPLTVISLGLSPTKEARVTTTASAVLLDTRNGYVYGTAEATENNNRLASAWTSDDAVDMARLKTESAAFEKLVGDLEKMWGGVVRRYAPSAPQPASGG